MSQKEEAFNLLMQQILSFIDRFKFIDKAKKEVEDLDPEEAAHHAATVIDPPYTETSEFKKQVDKESKKDPFDEAMKKVHEK